MNYTYILRCGDGTYYTGWTNDLEKRVRTHNQGRGGKYTRARTPVELAYYETFETKEEAMSREAAIKRLPRKEKEALVRQFGRRTLTGGSEKAGDLSAGEPEKNGSMPVGEPEKTGDIPAGKPEKNGSVPTGDPAGQSDKTSEGKRWQATKE